MTFYFILLCSRIKQAINVVFQELVRLVEQEVLVEPEVQAALVALVEQVVPEVLEELEVQVALGQQEEQVELEVRRMENFFPCYTSY